MNHPDSLQLNVLVMHADPIVCAGVVAALREHQTFVVFADRRGAAIETGPRVDVAIADLDRAMLLMTEGASERRAALPGAKILALTSNDREAAIRQAIRAGIHGYFLLGGCLDELIDAVWAVGTGARYLCPIVAQRMAESIAADALTQRENQVLRLVATGHSNKAIARLLAIELGTVKSHVSAIMTKLGAISRTQAANIAVTRGLVEEGRPYQAVNHPSGAPMSRALPQFA